MSKFRKIILITLVLILATSITAFAASEYGSPAEIVADLTGKSVDQVISQRQEEGKTFGQIADEQGQRDAFNKEMFELKEDGLQQAVEEGRLSQEQANELLERMQERQDICIGEGPRDGRGFGMGMGRRNSTKYGQGRGGCFGWNR